MKCHSDIKQLALSKFEDALCLFNNERFDGAFYFAGYSIELLIKCKVCKNLGIEDFFDFDNRKKFVNDNNIIKPFKVHNPQQLLILSGIYPEFINELKINNDFKAAWGIISNWTENSRYLTGNTKTDVENLLTSIKKFEEWILKYL